eukprot:12375927-Prorocentrum_lima.AAC.1
MGPGWSGSDSGAFLAPPVGAGTRWEVGKSTTQAPKPLDLALSAMPRRLESLGGRKGQDC